jgi:hypothetical protein
VGVWVRLVFHGWTDQFGFVFLTILDIRLKMRIFGFVLHFLPQRGTEGHKENIGFVSFFHAAVLGTPYGKATPDKAFWAGRGHQEMIKRVI